MSEKKQEELEPSNIAGRLAKIFIDHPLTLMLGLLILVMGYVTLQISPREANPQIVVAGGAIIVPYPGVKASEIQKVIIEPMQRRLREIEGVENIFGIAQDDFAILKTPIGSVKIIGNNEGISSIKILDKELDTSKNIPDNLKECVLQLKEYFQKKRTDFDLQLNPQGTDFQKKVWNELQQIPYGKTTTYLKQSISLGNAKTIRAVAAANSKNLLWIVIPCHRVIGTNGSLTGYAGGIWRKKWLLEHENPSTQMQLF